MAKTITRIPASVNRYTAKPIAEKTKRRVAGYARVSTEHEEQAPAMRLRWIIIPTTLLPVMIGFLSGCILMRVLQLQTPKEEKALIR